VIQVVKNITGSLPQVFKRGKDRVEDVMHLASCVLMM